MSILRLNKPHIIACLGYALFLATNATVIWGGVFPFLPMDFQTPDIISVFFLMQSGIFALCYFISALGSYFFPGPTKKFHIWAACVPYALGWFCLLAAVYCKDISLVLSYCGGGLIGFGSAGFFMAWQRLFAAQKADIGNRNLIIGTLIAPIIYFTLYLIPIAVTAFLMPLVFMPLFGLCIVLTSRESNLDQPMFNDVPREHPLAYRHALKDYWRSAFCIGSLAFSCGIIRALALETPQFGAVVNMASMLALFVGAGVLLFVWQRKSLRLNISLFFRVFFPFVVTAFVLLPALGGWYLNILAGVLYALYGCVIVLIMIQCAQASRDRGINPIFLYGFVAGVVYGLHDLGFISGSYVRDITLFGMDPVSSVSFLSVYALGIMFFVGQGGFKTALSPSHRQAERIELVATSANSLRNRPSAGMSAGVAQNDRDSENNYRDRLSKQCILLQKHFKLSDREMEIIEAVARGNTIAGIATMLGISENTTRTHSKRIYTKLDIHKKQELLDLVRSFDPKALTDNNS